MTIVSVSSPPDRPARPAQPEGSEATQSPTITQSNCWVTCSEALIRRYQFSSVPRVSRRIQAELRIQPLDFTWQKLLFNSFKGNVITVSFVMNT